MRTGHDTREESDDRSSTAMAVAVTRPSGRRSGRTTVESDGDVRRERQRVRGASTAVCGIQPIHDQRKTAGPERFSLSVLYNKEVLFDGPESDGVESDGAESDGAVSAPEEDFD